MNIRLRHQLQGDGRVLITTGGDRPMMLHVPSSEAKRFAWAMLADLDPDGAEEAGSPVQAVCAPVVGAGDRRAPWGSQIEAIAAMLDEGPMDTAAVARALDVSRNHASVLLSRLKACGVIEMTKAGRPHSPATWQLGPVSYAEWVEIRNGRLGG